MTAYRKFVLKEPKVKGSLLILVLKPLRSATKKYILVSGVPGNKKNFGREARNFFFFTYFLEDLTLPISFI